MSIHIEVDSEVNPQYLRTNKLVDYYGIYRVVKYDGDALIEVLKTFDDPFTDRRGDAYRYAGELIEQRQPAQGAAP